MLALFMSGRRDEALDAYEQASHVLDKEYGTHPGIELKTMLARVRRGGDRNYPPHQARGAPSHLADASCFDLKPPVQ
jgi:DNA-binding SARP family transcriptional activator